MQYMFTVSVQTPNVWRFAFDVICLEPGLEQSNLVRPKHGALRCMRRCTCYFTPEGKRRSFALQEFYSTQTKQFLPR